MKEKMTVTRCHNLCIGGTIVPLPCFFPSVSSIKTNLMPVDYIELLTAAAYPLWLVSAYDIANSRPEHQQRIQSALSRSRSCGSAILMDSGNYEGFWRGDTDWQPDTFHAVCSTYEHDLAFCYDNQEPPETADAISKEVVEAVLRDAEHSIGTIVPIVHGPTELLPAASLKVAEQLYPILLAVPERALGVGILARIQSVRKIRQALDALGFYCPLHLLGAGNPISIIVYTMAGADSFDGLEWCQTVVDHKTALLLHFQHWDFVREQTEWGSSDILPYIQSALLHNLDFYAKLMQRLQDAVQRHAQHEILETYLSKDRSEIIYNAIEGYD
jgi:queuine/archaeosine tRNA-ribosyltransferase